MYPTKKNPDFGTFIKVFDDGLKKYRSSYEIERVLIKGRSRNVIVKFGKYLLFYIQLLFCLLFRTYDLIYVHAITFPIPPVRIAGLFRNLNLVFNVHGADVLTKSRLAEYLKQLSRPLLNQSKYIIVPSKYFEQVIFKEFPELDKSKIVISASGGVEQKFFYKRKWQSHEVLKIGYVSRITKGKGWDTLLDALKILIDRHIGFQTVFAGFGVDSSRLISLTHAEVFRGKVQYMGPLGHDKLPTFFQSMDLFVFPSKECESLGLIGLEAMANSIPVIGSNIGGIATYLKDGINGFLFTPGNPVELADKIEKFIQLSESSHNDMMQFAYSTASEYETSCVLQKLFNEIFPQNEKD